MPPPQFSVNIGDVHKSLTIDPSGGVLRRNINIPQHVNWVTSDGKSIDTDGTLMGKEIVRQAKENLILKLNDCLVPAGQIGHFAHDSVPDGWLVCDGSEYDPNLYPRLARVIGTTWGSNSQYLLPDLHETFLRGTTDPSEMYTLNNSTNKSHNHTTEGGIHNHYNITMDNTGEHEHTIQIHSSSDYYPQFSKEGEDHFNTGSIRAGPPNATGEMLEVGAVVTGGSHEHGFKLNHSEIIPFRTGKFGISENRPKNINLLTCIKY